ncbi:MAG TPA: heavy metal-associated domain-containing protein, partial [Lacipirellulaceae bacterium]|nr:heavy metal-associated domain-containing protein [Lacipirellulaceae bacterium]
MTKLSFLASVALLSLVTAVIAGEPAPKPKAEPEPTKATYVITGLHCRPCTKTVESSLQKAKGVHSIKVDWDTKKASVEFDEAVLPAQKVAELIAETPHMMGRNMHYGGSLLLKIADIRDEDSAKPVEQTLSKVKGVKHVVAYPDQHSVGVEFDSKGKLTSQD